MQLSTKCTRRSHGSEQMAASSDNIMQRRKIPIRTSGSTAFQQGEGEGAQTNIEPWRTLLQRTRGTDLAFALANWDGFRDQRPPVSAASTTRRAPHAPESSGYVDTLAWRASRAPSCAAHLQRGCPSALIGDTSVVSTAKLAPPNRGSPSAKTPALEQAARWWPRTSSGGKEARSDGGGGRETPQE